MTLTLQRLRLQSLKPPSPEINASIKWCVPHYVHTHKKTWETNQSWWTMHVSTDLVRGHCFDYSRLPLSLPRTHREKFAFRARVGRKIGFLILLPMPLKPVWDQALLKLLCCRMMLCWNELEHWTTVCVRVCVFVCLYHTFHISVRIQPSSLPLPAFISYSHIFQSTSCCSAVQYPSLAVQPSLCHA